jgi:diguanylate cyclase (GGDEF)-like protein
MSPTPNHEQASPEQSEPMHLPGANLESTVLVVDDQATVRFIVRKALAGAGMRVIEASCAAEALEILEEDIPDLILLDVVMPEMNGFELCEALRARSDTRHVPVLMMTSLDDDASINKAYDAGATDFVSKPFRPVLLLHRVRYMLRARRNEQQVYQLAYYDSLTRLANREYFIQRLRLAISHARRHDRVLAILFLDLDDFKRVNDTLGHNVGDQLLQAVAERLPACVREDDLVASEFKPDGRDVFARIGGDEFLIMLSEIRRKEDAARVAQRILASLREPVSLAGYEVLVTPSIGIAVYPDNASDAESLLKNADTAMYSAKRAGKNLYHFYDEEMNATAERRLMVDNQLRRALARDEMRLHYQPLVDSIDAKVTGVEALLRWRCAELGAVPPDEFIPIAEESGLIIEIGEWVLREACRQMRKWQRAGLNDIRMAVNISMLQFLKAEFVELVHQILEETGLPPGSLELELTESLLMEDVDRAVQTLHAIKNLGVSVAVDDFGTGYCGLNYLKKFSVDRLKIDRLFVKEVCSSRDDAAIASAIIGLADSLSLDVIAEGVETVEQLEFLKSKGCREVQGYLFGEDVERVLRAPVQAVAASRHLLRTGAKRIRASRPIAIRDAVSGQRLSGRDLA